jgi:two-component sensor histidine kinase
MALATPAVRSSPVTGVKLSSWRERLRTARRAASLLAVLAALLSGGVLLFGWMLDIQVVRRLPGEPGMAVTVAGGVLACAILLMRRIWLPAAARWYDRLPAAVLLAVAFADLAFLAADPDTGLDHWLFGFSDARSDTYMSPATAVSLALGALCLMLPFGRRRLWGEFFGLLVACGLAITVLAITGYLFDSAALREVFVFSAMAPQTALAMLLVFLALAASQPAQGWMRILLLPRPGSASLRRLLPFVALGPFVLCWLALVAVDRGMFDANFRLSVVAMAGAAGLIVLLFWSAQRENASACELMQSNRRLRRTLAERDVLLKEVYHRVKNNLQFFDAMLALEANGLAGGAGDAQERLEVIRSRVHALSLVHQQLIGAQDLATLDLQPFLNDLCANLAQGTALAARRVRVATDIPSIPVTLDCAVPIGLIVTELFLNAVKHAFPDGREGAITVEAEQDAKGVLTLCIGDDGVGRAGEAPVQSQVGSLILSSLVTQLKARMMTENRAGLRVTIQVPPSSA